MSAAIVPSALHVANKAGSIETLNLQRVQQPMPVANPGDVVVQVHAAAINPSDVKATLGIMPHAVFPRTPGRDFAGQVVAGASRLIGPMDWGPGKGTGITRNGSQRQSNRPN